MNTECVSHGRGRFHVTTEHGHRFELQISTGREFTRFAIGRLVWRGGKKPENGEELIEQACKQTRAFGQAMNWL
jgi:hypothetical protein